MPLLLSPLFVWSMDEAFRLVKNELLPCLPGEGWKNDRADIL